MFELALLIIAYSLSLAVIAGDEKMLCIKKVGSGDSHQCVSRLPAGEKGGKGDPGNVNETAYNELQSKEKNAKIVKFFKDYKLISTNDIEFSHLSQYCSRRFLKYHLTSRLTLQAYHSKGAV